MSTSQLTSSCKFIGTLLAHCFLKIYLSVVVVVFFQYHLLLTHKPWGVHFKNKSANYSNFG